MANSSRNAKPKRGPLVSTIDVDKQWFAEKRAEQMISLRKLSSLLEVEPSAMSRMMDGKRQMSANEAAAIARHLVVPVEEVLRRAGIEVLSDHELSAPVVGAICGAGRVTMGEFRGPKSVSCPSGGSGLCALRVQTGDRYDGWLFFYRPRPDANDGVPAEAVGQLCVVRTVGSDSLFLRWVSRGYEPGYWTLVPPFFAHDEVQSAKVRSAIPIQWIRQI